MIRLLLTDGLASARAALRLGLGERAGLQVVGEAGDGDALLAQLGCVAPAVLLLDLNLPGPDACGLLPAVRAQYPALRILARGELTNECYASRALDLGAHGYVLKTSLPAELAHGLRTVAAGRPFLCSAVGLAMLGRLHRCNPASGDVARVTLGLSKREMEVLGLVAEGLTNTEIALKLFTSKRTVETHRQNIMDKTQTRNTASLIRMAASQGLLPE